MLRQLAVALTVTMAIGLSGTSAKATPSVVASPGGYAPGTIVVKTNERKLYLILGEGQALRYPVGVGKAGKQWAGATRIDGKYRQPAWSPPADVKRDNPSIPDVIPGGSPSNPMGVAAMTLAGGEYAIPRHQSSELRRRLCLLRLRADVQSGHQRSVRARRCRHAGGCHLALRFSFQQCKFKNAKSRVMTRL